MPKGKIHSVNAVAQRVPRKNHRRRTNVETVNAPKQQRNTGNSRTTETSFDGTLRLKRYAIPSP